ncbi:hypothetical protein Q2490_11080 [Myroides odoratimimus]|uniref:hypothetical protein n=1 Tax=Myroides odoratimimus TaxID=76832 RepID=UPI002578B3B0|nr:hypothetical protein [Myroides odoratimimus]MDM1094112.1 hypothetical protein [Myroides odoratimimus]MDM1520172.1 hypothetical protein [Myroides odoratimimus]MDO5857829.1 hypothetical protein [Myroides odoratimimus]MEC4028355.1 hypothetical protein [Myroides odoratimimus]MEC4036881.1 hypothetical protein [Myroides odoratimimus]
MKSYYSLIRYFNNSLSRENIVIGLIAVSSTNNVFYKFSESKISFITRFYDNKSKLLNFNIKKISEVLELNAKEDLFIEENTNILKKYLDRLAVYNNGIIQFDKPVELNMNIDAAFFSKFYEKYIGDLRTSTKSNKKDEVFYNRINSHFRKPLEDIIDIDYKIEKKVIPSLFFDYKLNGIGGNGSIYSVKCIDINSNRTIDTIQKDISELESLNFRLNDFSKQLVEYPEQNKHYLVIDQYKGIDEKYLELYDTLSNQENELYRLINSNQLEEVTADILRTGASKFSELILR